MKRTASGPWAEAPASPKPVLFLDLRRQYESIQDELQEAVARVVASQMYILGPEVEALEREIAGFIGTKRAIGVSSGTDALLLSLMALGIGPGDEVIVPTFTFFATAGVVARLGARPVFADIDPETYNIDPASLEAAITPRTRAMIPVHLYGQCVEMAEILEIASRHHIPVIEDAAQAIGADYEGRRAGSMGRMGCFSFYPTKNLNAIGEAGMIATSDPEIGERLVCLRNHGMNPVYHHRIVGGNFRLDAIQAAALRVKLRRLEDWNEGRRDIAALYTRLFEESGLAGESIRLPKANNGRHVFHQFVISVADRDALAAHVKARGVGCNIYYPIPLHLQECFADLGYKPGDLPVSEAAAQSVLALPIFPELTEEEVQWVVDSVVGFYRR